MKIIVITLVVGFLIGLPPLGHKSPAVASGLFGAYVGEFYPRLYPGYGYHFRDRGLYYRPLYYIENQSLRGHYYNAPQKLGQRNSEFKRV